MQVTKMPSGQVTYSDYVDWLGDIRSLRAEVKQFRGRVRVAPEHQQHGEHPTYLVATNSKKQFSLMMAHLEDC